MLNNKYNYSSDKFLFDAIECFSNQHSTTTSMGEKTNYKKKRIIQRDREKHIINRLIILLIIITFLGPTVAPKIINKTIRKNVEDIGWVNTKDTSDIPNTLSIAENLDTIALLKPETWNTLTYDEKFETMCIIKNIELNKLGIDITDMATLKTDDLDSGVQGNYSNLTSVISIDCDLLAEGDVEEVLNTICHESRHCYQHACVEAYKKADDKYKNLLIFDTSKDFRENFNNYIKGNDDNYLDYWNQCVEADARAYAQEEVEYYNSIIRENNL